MYNITGVLEEEEKENKGIHAGFIKKKIICIVKVRKQTNSSLEKNELSINNLNNFEKYF